MKYLTIVVFISQLFVVFTDAAAANANCVAPSIFRTSLLLALKNDLGLKFVEDFDSTYKRTIAIAQLQGVPCYDQGNGEFICSTLKTVYKTRLPKSLDTITKDCEKVLNDLYAVN